VAVATWHLAVSDTVGAELPHDLLALWLFPEAGGVALLGPAALAQDNLVVPRPLEFLGQEQLLALEDRVRLAGYASVIAAPIRGPTRDLGLMLLAALSAGRFGPLQAIRLFEILSRFSPAFQRLAARMPASRNETTLPVLHDAEAMPQALARTLSVARTGAELVNRLSAALHGLLPHDHLGILVPGFRAGSWEWVGQESSRPRWGGAESGGDRAAPRGLEMLEERLSEVTVLAVADLATDRTGLHWPSDRDHREPPMRVHAMLAAALDQGGDRIGYLLLGSAATDLYRPEDEARLASVVDIIAARVTALRARAESESLRRTVAALEGPGGAMARVVRHLAATAHFGVATREAAAVLREVTGATTCRFILRLGSAEAVALEPGEVRPLLDLPLLPLAGARFAPVLSGEIPLLLHPVGPNEELCVPLRIAGRPFGALLLTAPAGGRLAAVTNVAQQLADAIAPHLELVRRAAGAEVSSER